MNYPFIPSEVASVLALIVLATSLITAAKYAAGGTRYIREKIASVLAFAETTTGHARLQVMTIVIGFTILVVLVFR